MILSKRINQILGCFGIAIMRKSTLGHLTENRQLAASIDGLVNELKEIKTLTARNQEQLLRHQIGVKWHLVDRLDQCVAQQDDMQSCPLCGHRGDVATFPQFVTDCIFEGGILNRQQCPACDLIFGPEKMLSLSEAQLTSDYEWHYQLFSEGDSTAQEIRAFYALKPERDKNYLNWGCGAWSKTIETLRQEGWNVYGYEPHGSATQANAYIISSYQQLSAIKFDGIFSNNVLEHLRYPVRELSLMRDLLGKGGKMSHATPCFEYLYEFTRFHLFFYLGRSRAHLAAQAKLGIDEFVVDGEFMNLILTID